MHVTRNRPRSFLRNTTFAYLCLDCRIVELFRKYIRDTEFISIFTKLFVLHTSFEGNYVYEVVFRNLSEIICKCSHVCESFNNRNNFPENASARGNTPYSCLCSVSPLAANFPLFQLDALFIKSLQANIFQVNDATEVAVHARITSFITCQNSRPVFLIPCEEYIFM